MAELLAPYQLSILVLGLSGALFLIQLAIVDIVAIKQKHPPGVAVAQDPDDWLFRCNRVFANSNETVGIFVLVILFAMFSGADPRWLNTIALTYLFSRVGHMLCYYFGQKILRSVAFGVCYLSLLGIFIIGLSAWLN
ncbi:MULTISPECIES: MAPEG family protein [unclassified Pseudoalteromonas]|uniref:MAPEG family protein n=1 Tax=unclassified Pseudoalteromonas TaxID=194690 RepID=UPI002097EBB5|nr:MAPEG family protein [Pseudoalteromonas sp. XMcav2-N]MCO7187961.1 MAPEG family protein [Pseudoalteromonas sp. XMcav2-N]